MKPTRVLGITVAAAAMLGLAACSTSADATDAAAPKDEKAAQLTLYTSEPEEKITALIDEFNADHPKIKINVFRAGTGELTARIAAEQKAGKIGADLLLAADAPTFERYADEKLLLEYESPESAHIMPDLVDPEHMYVGTRLLPTVIAVNTNEITDKPTSWQDLTDSKYAGKITLPNPDVSGAAAYNAAVWLDEPKLGKEWLAGLAANKPVIAESNGPVSQAVASGSNPVGIVVDSLVRDLAAQGSPIAAVYPKEGVPFVSQPVGIFANTKEPEAAKTFVDFLISKKGQEVAVSQNYLPIRKDVKSPKGAPEISKLTLLNPDLKKIQASQEGALATFHDLFK